MSFGFSVGDAVLLGQLAWKTVQNSRKACGEHDELTREVSSLHAVIRRLEKEAARPESILNRPDGHSKEELSAIVAGCEEVLKVLNRVLKKYNTLSERERSAKRLWQKVRFGNGELADVRDLRAKLAYCTSALSLFVNTISIGSIGKVEQQMETAGEDIREIRIAVNGITAQLLSTSNREGSVLTTYADDDKAVWKEFRRELIAEGFSSSILRKHKQLIMAYINELGDRGLFDDEDPYGIEESSESAGINVKHHASPSTEPQSPPKSSSPGLSRTVSINLGDDRSSASENTVDHTPRYIAGTDIYPSTVRQAESQNASEMDEPEEVLCRPRFGNAACKESSSLVEEYSDPFPNKTALLAGLPGDCLTVGRTDPSLLTARFQARLQILLECFPHICVFRARNDIDEVTARVEKCVVDDSDREVLARIAESGHNILVDLTGSLSWVDTNSAHILIDGLDVFDQSAFHSQRASFTKLEALISSELNIEDYATGEWKVRSSEMYNVLNLKGMRQIGDWIRLFDSRIGTIPERLTNKWTKVIERITTARYSSIKSLYIDFAEGMRSIDPARTYGSEWMRLSYCFRQDMAVFAYLFTQEGHDSNDRHGVIEIGATAPRGRIAFVTADTPPEFDIFHG